MSAKPEFQKIYPLSPMQEGMLFYSLISKNDQVYFNQVIHSIYGQIDQELLKQSLELLIKRHDILRTNFVYQNIQKPRQVVFKEKRPEFSFIDISDYPAVQKETMIQEVIAKDRQRGFDLLNDILMRVLIMKTGAKSYKLVWSFHHIIMDGWCNGIIISDFFLIYQQLKNHQPLVLDHCNQYDEYIKWLERQDKDAAKAYWENYLAGYEQSVTVPRLSQPLRMDEYQPGKVVFSIDEAMIQKLNEIAVNYRVTLSVIFQAIWGILLHIYNNVDDAVFGMVVSGRPPQIEGIEKTVGLFINTLPMRVTKSKGQLFSELVQEIQQASLMAEKYSYFPLVEVQANTILKQNLINHIVAFENYPVSRAIENMNAKQLLGFDIDENIEYYGRTNYDFEVIISAGKELSVRFAYNALIYQECFIKNIENHFTNIGKQIIENRDIQIEKIEILTLEEKERILSAFNHTKTDYPKDKTIHQLFEEQTQEASDRVAVVFENKQLTYGELNEKVNQLARFLRQKGVKPDTIVGIMVERSLEMIIGIIGILKAGGAYLPIDPDYPEERKKYLLKDSGAEILLIQNSVDSRLKTLPKIACHEELIEVINLDDESLYNIDSSNLPNVNSPSDLAYIMYTSGSTGKPKGVLVEHRSIVRLVKNTDYIEFQAGDRILQTGAIVFDATTFEFWGALTNGLQLYLTAEATILDAPKLKQELHKNQITTLWLTSPLFNQLAAQDPAMFQGLRYLLVGGDVLSPAHINRVRRQCPDITIINGYGPTENTTFSVCFKIDQDYQTNIPIGKPIRNSTAYIVNSNQSLQPIGVPGELYVGGDGLARGYLNCPELTAEKFIEQLHVESGKLHVENQQPSTFNLQPSTRFYRTGDLARWLSDGNIEFISRKDNQVKIRGFRIEPGEIEAKLSDYKTVQEAVVIPKADPEGNKYLCAYFTAKSEIPAAKLREYLAQELPDYMIPSYFIQLDKLPLTPNGKVDHKALPKPGGSINTGVEYVAPETELEFTISSIWKEILGLEKVGVHDQFFDLGGNSLSLLKLTGRINQALKKQIAITTLFQYPTIRSFVQYLVGKEDMEDHRRAVEEKANDSLELMGMFLRDGDERK